jgi:hypothetical protein
MSIETNGVTAPNDPALAEIDAVIDDDQQPVIEETHKLASKLSELEQQLRAKDEVISRRDRDYQSLVETSRKQSEMLSELVGDIRDAKDRGYQYERERLQGIQRKAATEADVAAYDDAERAIRALDHHRATAETKPAADAPKSAATPQSQPDPAAIAWVSENPWFHADPDLYEYALMRERKVGTSNPHMSTAERLAKVKEDVLKRFPEKFPNAARQQPPTVSRPGPQAAGRPKPKEPTLADLDEDHKAALAAIKRVDPKFKDETYLKGFKAREARQKEIGRL